MGTLGRLALLGSLLPILAGAAWIVTRTASIDAQSICHPAYPDLCIPPSPPDLNCVEIDERNFRAFQPDPHDLDEDDDGIACEDGSKPAFPTRTTGAFRVFAPMVACQDCVPVASPTATATPTSTGTASPTASATLTQAPTATSTATPTATPTTATCAAATATIAALDKSGESVTISGAGLLTGWYVISESGNQRFDFPAGYILNGSVILDSGPGASHNPPATLLWTTENIWNNSEDDDAFLYDCQGALRSAFEDGD